MKPDLKPTGRVAGMLFLAQGLIAIPVYTSAGLMGSITTSRFLTAAAVDADKIQAGMMLAGLVRLVRLGSFEHVRRLNGVCLSLMDGRSTIPG